MRAPPQRAGAGRVRDIRAGVRARACREFYEKQNEVITHRLEIIEKIEATRTLVLDKAARRREVSEVELHKIWKEEADESACARASACAPFRMAICARSSCMRLE